jgi:RNA polymerase sigma-70 factor (ECF subfamily)
MIPPQDAELVARWRRGEAAAFEEIVRRWQQPMARFLFRLSADSSLVADLCQEVFLRVFTARDRYRENGRFASWLYRIALNVARDVARRRRPAPVTAAEPLDRAAGAEDVCRQRELRAAVSQAVAELPEALRLVLVLRHDEGMSFEDIGRLTGTPASTLKSRFAAALRQLRARLEERGYGPEEILP